MWSEYKHVFFWSWGGVWLESGAPRHFRTSFITETERTSGYRFPTGSIQDNTYFISKSGYNILFWTVLLIWVQENTHEGPYHRNALAGETWRHGDVPSVPFIRYSPSVCRRCGGKEMWYIYCDIYTIYYSNLIIDLVRQTHTHILTLIRTNASIVDVAVFKSISAILRR